MKKLIAAASVVVFAPASIAEAKPLSHSEAVAYGRAYAHVKHVFGLHAVGCKLIGPNTSCHGHPTDEKIRRSTEVLHRMLAPRPVYHSSTVAHYSNSSVHYSSYSSSSGGCGGSTPYAGGGQCWAIPYSIVSCESGGSNVSNSQGSGATGYYQLMSGGGGSKSEQDQAAARLWNGGAGRSNWVC